MGKSFIVDNYLFDPVARTVAFLDLSTVRLEGIRAIVNVSSGVTIYRYDGPEDGGTVNVNVLTLEYDTSRMSASDKLMIVYEEPAPGFFTGLSDYFTSVNTALDAVAFCIQRLAEAVRFPDFCQLITSGKALRVFFDASSSLPTLANVTTVATTTNLTNLNTVDSRYVIWNGWTQNYINGIRSKIT